jgi:hypothetical protein
MIAAKKFSPDAHLCYVPSLEVGTNKSPDASRKSDVIGAIRDFHFAFPGSTVYYQLPPDYTHSTTFAHTTSALQRLGVWGVKAKTAYILETANVFLFPPPLISF